MRGDCERVADHNARVAPVAHVTVVLGWQAFEQREGAVAQRFAPGDAAVGELQDGNEVDADDIGLERAQPLGVFVACDPRNVVRAPVVRRFDAEQPPDVLFRAA